MDMRKSVVAAVLLVSTVASIATADAAESVTTERLAGSTRYDTAGAISRATWEAPRSSAVLARGDQFPDALVAAHVAGDGDGGAPVLLTDPDRLPPATIAELERLQVRSITLMGSEAAISGAVERELVARGYATTRIAGATRYDTAALTVDVDDNGLLFVASGERFADALSAGPVIYGGPALMLTPRDYVHPALRRILRDRSITRILILGGTAAVSSAVEAELRTICNAEGVCPDVGRLAGRDRLETATAVADYLIENRRLDVTHVNIARSDTFPDALAGGPHGGQEGAPVIFSASPTVLGEATRTWLEQHSDTIRSIHAFGDSSAVSDQVLEQARQAATAP